MRFSRDKAESRREFFRTAGRYGLAGLLAAAATVLVRRQSAVGQRCINQGICRGCGVFAACGLPQALSAKQTQAGG